MFSSEFMTIIFLFNLWYNLLHSLDVSFARLQISRLFHSTFLYFSKYLEFAEMHNVGMCVYYSDLSYFSLR